MSKQTISAADFAKHRRVRDRDAILASHRTARPPLRAGVRTLAAQATAAPGPVGQARNGTPTDVLLQGFHWTSSSSQNPNWYQILAQNAAVIKNAGFDLVWFPPPTATADSEGYMPTKWYDLDSGYGSTTDLTAAIAALQPLRILADVVVNHRLGLLTPLVDFDSPAFADQAGAVTKDDECNVGTGNYDTGTTSSYARDLDHTAVEVQNGIIAYLNSLQAVGFTAWRYDMAMGYAGSYVGQYNQATVPYLSVGEFWDGDRQNVVDWINRTGATSMAFDFPTRFYLQTAIDQRQFGQLKDEGGKPNGAIGFWPGMCVTFIADHDMEQDHMIASPFGDADQVLQGYAYILTHPGLPCVFWTHFFDWGQPIQQAIQKLISIRKTAGLNSNSVVNIVAADDGKYAAIIDAQVALKLGPAPWDPGTGWTVATSGNDFAIWTINS